VGTEQRDDLAAVYPDRHLVDRGEIAAPAEAEPLAHPPELEGGRVFHRLQRPSTRCTVRPSSCGPGAICTPALSRASILSFAPPLSPEMIAPACPMRFLGVAVVPAMNHTSGFFRLSAQTEAACSYTHHPI